eukprot:3132246-Prymnesium_polylepis.2
MGGKEGGPKRPGRSTAGSMSARRLVSAMTKVGTGRLATPSIRASSWLTTESRAAMPPSLPPFSEPRRRAIASNSSSTMTCSSFSSAAFISASPEHVDWAGTGGACMKSARSAASELPMNLSITSGPLTIVGGRRERPVARRAARYDLPQPGGPWSSSPLTGSPPSSSSRKRGAHSGTHMRRRMLSSTSSSPPTSSTTRLHAAGSSAR